MAIQLRKDERGSPRPPRGDPGPPGTRAEIALGFRPGAPRRTPDGEPLRARLRPLARRPLPGLPRAARARPGAPCAGVRVLVRVPPRGRAPRAEPPGALLVAGDVHRADERRLRGQPAAHAAHARL